MKNIIPFTKEIKFNNRIAEITSISLEENYNSTSDSVDGEFRIYGEYRPHELSVNKEEFEYFLPFSVDLTSDISKDSLKLEITDFSYDILNDNILKVNIEFMIEAQEESDDEILLSSEDLLDNRVILPLEDEIVKTDVEVSNLEKDEEYSTIKIHEIKSNETYESICQMYNIDLNTLKEYNDLNEFVIGGKLIIPDTNE